MKATRVNSYHVLLISLLLAVVSSPDSQAQVQSGDMPDPDVAAIRPRHLPWIGQGRGGDFVGEVSDSALTAYVTRLAAFRTRRSCTDSNRVAGDWIHDTFQQLGFTEVYFDSFPYPSGPCDIQRNVVAVKPGSMFSDKALVIGGHYDSMTNPESGCDPDTLAPGADDNASGTAVVLEMARLLVDQETDLTLIFLTIAAEEMGGYGSEHFAENARSEGLDIRTMFNVDMVGNELDDMWRIEVNVDSASIPYGELIVEIGTQHTDMIPFLTTPIAPVSDHYSFYLFGFNSAFFHEDDFSSHWHRCTDTIDNMNIPYFAEAAEMVLQSVLYSANMPDLPSGFHVSNAGDGESLFLSWDPNTDPDFSEYRVHYGTQPGIYDSVRTVTSTADTLRELVEGAMYYLALSAVDNAMYQSPLTPEIAIRITSQPYVPVEVTSTSLSGEILIEWDMEPGSPPFDGYNIYRWEVDGDPDTVQVDFVPEPLTVFRDDAAEPHIIYGYYVTSVDNQVPTNESDPSDPVYGRLATRDRGILLVDNTLDGTGGAFMPTDGEVDTYYSNLFRNYDVGASWDISDSVGADRAIMDYDLGIYSTVMWHSDVRGSVSEPSDTTMMRRYLELGGNLWLSGWQLLAFITGRSESYFVFEEDDFVGRYAGIDSARTTSSADQDFIGVESMAAGFPDLFVDPEKVAPIGALFNTELLLLPFGDAVPLHAYISSDSAGSAYHGLPVASVSTSPEYNLVVTDFPLYFMHRDDALTLVDAVMGLFVEPASASDDGEVRLPATYSLSQNYPNPFNPSTTITFDIPGEPGTGRPARLDIYDVRGRQVRTLIDTVLEPGRHTIHWDGRDDRGLSAPSGFYLYTLRTRQGIFTRKMAVLK